MKEIYKIIPKYPNYEISNLGSYKNEYDAHLAYQTELKTLI